MESAYKENRWRKLKDKGEYTMMRREEFLRLHPDVKGEMVAYSKDGEKLGRITALNQDTINIEKGFFFPRDFAVPYDNIVDIHGNEMVIDQHRAALSDWQKPEYEGWSRSGQLGQGQEINIPLWEEDLEARKTSHQKGEVHLKKVVHTEQRTITVPVTSEEVVVEHTPMSESGELGPDEMAFREEDMTIPIMEEEVEVVKRQRVREAIHAKKVAHTEQREMSGDVRIEDIEVERAEGLKETSGKERGKV